MNASSGCLDFLVIRNVSALIGAVTVPLYDGSAARFQLAPADSRQQTSHRKFSCMATLPELNAVPPPLKACPWKTGPVMMKWSVHMPL